MIRLQFGQETNLEIYSRRCERNGLGLGAKKKARRSAGLKLLSGE
jgi:hypothetical protein